MDDLLSRCQWPPLPTRYEQALRECVAFLLGRFDVTAILACGTIVRGIPDASSDLDMYVLHNGDFMQRIQRFFNGVPTEMFVNPPAQVLRHMEREQGERRPVAAHMIVHGFPVLDMDDRLDALKARAMEYLKQEPDVPEHRLTMERYNAASLFEDAQDVCQKDPETAAMILAEAVGHMLAHSFSRAKVFHPRKKSLLDVLATIDAETARLAREFYATADLVTRFELAGLIADRTIETHGFFEWEGAQIKVEG
jgi:hypothetical protein